MKKYNTNCNIYLAVVRCVGINKIVIMPLHIVIYFVFIEKGLTEEGTGFSHGSKDRKVVGAS